VWNEIFQTQQCISSGTNLQNQSWKQQTFQAEPVSLVEVSAAERGLDELESSAARGAPQVSARDAHLRVSVHTLSVGTSVCAAQMQAGSCQVLRLLKPALF
jgi:hypothetical protein